VPPFPSRLPRLPAHNDNWCICRISLLRISSERGSADHHPRAIGKSHICAVAVTAVQEYILGSMDSSRANHGAKRRASWHAQFHNYPRWIRMPDLGCLRDSVSSGQKRIFAIVSAPIPTPVAGKTIRRIVIFDNHPDSLRLVLKSGLDLDGDAAASRRERRASIICGFILIAMVVAALLWPLCW
jgi:hypothetical protein